MQGPAIKGSAFEAVATDLKRLRDDGHLPVELLETRLEGPDLALLESKVGPAQWIPIASYRRMTELLLEVEGRGRSEYVVDRGRRAAERLFATGLYYQLQRGEERGAESRTGGPGWTEADGRLITSLAGAIFNFTRWHFHAEGADAQQSRVEVEEADAWPDVARLAAQGFIEYTATRVAGTPMRVESHRPTPDRVVFELRRLSA